MQGRPAARIVIDSVAQFRAFHESRGNWGPLHLMFANGTRPYNFRDDILDACEIMAQGDEEAMALIAILRKIPTSRRRTLSNLANTKKKGRPFGEKAA